MTSVFYTYLHCRPDGVPFYVGKSVNLKRVFSLHRNIYHDRIVQKFGSKNILTGYLECSTEQNAFELEIGLIRCLRKQNVKLSNLTDGGEGTSNPPQEIRDRISRGNKGRTKPENVRQAVRESNQNRVWSASSLQKLSLAAKGRTLTPEHVEKVASKHRGSKRSEETKRRIGDAMRTINTGRKQTPEQIAKRVASRLKTLKEKKNAV